MDQIAFTIWSGLSNFSFLFLLLLSSLLVFLHLKFIQLKTFASPCPLPPGPKPWPIIGNIMHMGKKPHISLANIAKDHGPLISLRLGTQLLVVGSSPEAATEILKTHDRLLAGRMVPKSVPHETHILDRLSIVWASECNNQYWKSFRGMCKNDLFSTKALDSQVTLREKKVAQMVEFLGTKEGKVVDIGEAVFATIFNMLGNLLLSRELIGFEDGAGGAGRLKKLVGRVMVLVSAPNIADFYPILAGLDPQGIKRQIMDCLEEAFAMWEICIKERRETNVHTSPKGDFLDTFLTNGLDDDQINWLLFELFAAGSDTTTTTAEWAMAELLKNEEIMEKVREELEKEINGNSIKECHVSQLPYLNACIKETLRLHPPTPFLIPRRAAETCQIMGYRVPKNCQVLVNVWAIGRDLSVWEDPLSFKPDRFLGTSWGRDLELLPAFGGGRRICPGMPMAIRQLPLILASLLYHFDWSLPNGQDLSSLDMNDKFGITLHKEQPVLLVPRRIM